MSSNEFPPLSLEIASASSFVLVDALQFASVAWKHAMQAYVYLKGAMNACIPCSIHACLLFCHICFCNCNAVGQMSMLFFMQCMLRAWNYAMYAFIPCSMQCMHLFVINFPFQP